MRKAAVIIGVAVLTGASSLGFPWNMPFVIAGSFALALLFMDWAHG
jgi:hypothetical protein